MHVLIVAPEMERYTGPSALGELVETHARALAGLGHQTTVIAPFFGGVMQDSHSLARRLDMPEVRCGSGPVQIGLFDGKLPSDDVRVIFVDHPEIFGQSPWAPGPDNALRAELLCRAVPVAARELTLKIDVVHSFGWQAGLVPLLLRRGGADSPLSEARQIFSVNDASDAGLFDADLWQAMGMDPALFQPEGVEFHGKLSLLKAGLIAADRVVAASPVHARELCQEPHGGGLHGLFAALGDRLVGVLDGIDYTSWDPSSDHRILAHYDADSLEGKDRCKHQLQTDVGLPHRPRHPLFVAFMPRDAAGQQVLLNALPELKDHPLQIVLCGDAGPLDLDSLDGVRVLKPNDDQQLHRLLAGADAIICSTPHGTASTLIKALRFGAAPITVPVGSPRDVVVDFDSVSRTGTGLFIHGADSEQTLAAIQRALHLYGDQETWKVLQQNAMRQRFSKEQSAGRHLELYQ